MTRSARDFLAGVHAALLEPIGAIVQLGDLLLGEAGDREHAAFAADVRKVRDAGQKLRRLADDYLGPGPAAGEPVEEALAVVQSRVRHDMRNALNPVLNYCEMWLEDADEQFLDAFRADLDRIHRHGRECLALIDRVVAYRPDDEASPADRPAAADFADDGGPAVGPAAKPGYCLVVDDNATNRDILCRLLVRQGHRVATAENGREALDKIAADDFDLVLLDILMPELNGFQVLKHLKADPRRRDLPVVVISALDQDDSVVRCIALGAEDYLPKPFNPLLLKARIGACLEKKRFRDRETQYLRQIEQEQKRSDELLRVILPDEIVDELKTTNGVKPRRYDHVAVLFADIVGFTPYCDRHPPEAVVAHLQRLVESWENSALEHGVQKVKTIGDAFMACSGLLRPAADPVRACIRCGLEMIRATRELGIGWDLRVGVSVGQVVAGVIGRRQYLFDVWGDTVNTAARMESHGTPGTITLSADAWRGVAATARGEAVAVEVKGKGPLTVYRFREFVSPAPPGDRLGEGGS